MGRLQVMLPLLLVVQLATADPAPTTLSDLVNRAVERNRTVPAAMRGYRAQMESEIAVLTRRSDGEEGVLSVEQSINDVHWQRDGDFSQHLTAYRGRQAGPSLSALAVLRKAWAIPMLYGNEFGAFFGEGGMGRAGRDVAVHPLGAEGHRVYEIRGGDTIAVISTQQRTIRVVRVHVEPRREQTTWPVVAFRGEMDLDADRGEIIRLRGQFITLDRNGPKQTRLLVLPVNVMAYVDLESVEVDGRYWLPRYQRIETHVNLGGLAEGRSVFRIVSRFRHHHITENTDNTDNTEMAEPSARAHRLTIANGDSLDRPHHWSAPLGEITAQLRGDDFADTVVAAAAVPRLSWRAQRLADIVRFNRIEGWSTGATAEYTPGPSMSGFVLRANATWAWTERTVRGRVEAVRSAAGGGWRAGVRGGRTLAITNDFTPPWDSGGALLPALFGVDDYDYVDRASAGAWLDVNVIPRRATMRLELGASRDREAHARLTRGLFPNPAPFRPNRGIDEGAYGHTALTAEWNPPVNGTALATGIGGMLRSELAVGSLDWHRTTLRLNARADAGAMAYALRVDGGILTSRDAPPQQLFELGGGRAFPGHDYKVFAGDRALAGHARASYRLPVLRAPLRIMGCTCLASPAPELALALHGATLSASRPATIASMARLGTVDGVPVSAVSGRVRSSVEVGLRFFGGAMTAGLARPLDTGGAWRGTFMVGQAW